MKSKKAENASKAKEAADLYFPGEEWIKWEHGIFVSSRRKIGSKTNFKDELRDAQILRDTGSTVYLVPEDRSSLEKKYDAIVDGLQMEFKNQRSSSKRTLEDHFLSSRKQALNVFINLEESSLTKNKILCTLYRSRNSDDFLIKCKKINGGKILLRIKNVDRVIWLDIDDMKAK